MPESKSVYDIYRGAGVSAGEYQASLYETEDVWGKIESSRERSAFKQEQTGRTIDTLMSAVELGSQLYGGYKAKQEFEGDLGTLKEDMGDYEKVGKDDKLWSKMSRWEKMWDEPKYKFGEKTYGKEDITVLAQMKRYGIDIDSPSKSKVVEDIVSKAKEDEFETSPTSSEGKYEAVVGEGKEVDIGGDSMLQEAGLGGKELSSRGEAFKKARGEGLETFWWEGKEYTTDLAGGGTPKSQQEIIDELLKQLEGQGFVRPEFGGDKKPFGGDKKPEPLFGGGGQVWQD